MTDHNIDSAYQIAKQQYAAIGVDTEAAIERLQGIPVSMHCWQGDDVGGFETAGAELSGGGIQATGNYPGKARTIAELRPGEMASVIAEVRTSALFRGLVEEVSSALADVMAAGSARWIS